MRLSEIIALIEKKAPLDTQDEWDNSGWQVFLGDVDEENVVLTLDLTTEAIALANALESKLIITHHPLFFSGLKALKRGEVQSDKVLAAIENGISVYATHTPYDYATGGINDHLGQLFGLSDVKGFYPMEDRSEKHLGIMGDPADMELSSFTHRIKEALDLDSVIVYGDPTKPLGKVAVVGGSGSDFWPLCLERGVTHFVTSDVKYHTGLDAAERGLVLLDIGHRESETQAFYGLADDLTKRTGLTIHTCSNDETRRHFL